MQMIKKYFNSAKEVMVVLQFYSTWENNCDENILLRGNLWQSDSSKYVQFLNAVKDQKTDMVISLDIKNSHEGIAIRQDV